jgi:hypothetical protein
VGNKLGSKNFVSGVMGKAFGFVQKRRLAVLGAAVVVTLGIVVASQAAAMVALSSRLDEATAAKPSTVVAPATPTFTPTPTPTPTAAKPKPKPAPVAAPKPAPVAAPAIKPGPTAKQIADVLAARHFYEEEIPSVQAGIAVLQGELSKKEYFLSIAVAYNDSLRASVLNGEIATLRNQIASDQAYLADLQAKLAALPNY